MDTLVETALPPPPVWFITGASNGFGLLLCLRALKAGHNVIGTVRDRARSSAAVQSIEDVGGKIIEMDNTEAQHSIKKKIQDAEAIYGKIDILVNNAGYSILGPISSFTDKEVSTQLETNVYGPLFAIQAVLPGMRRRRSGTIVNISSVAGQDALPTSGLYAASKFALEALSEALAREEAEHGLHVLVVEPGAFRTNFLGAHVAAEKGLGGHSKDGVVGTAMGRWAEFRGQQAGDPQKGVEAIFQAVTGQGELAGHLRGPVFRRLPLGKDAVARIEAKTEHVRKDVEAARAVALSTDF